MKRLVGVVAALLFAVGVFAQGRDFSGSWVLDVEKSGTKSGPPTMTVALTAKEFKLTMGAGTERNETIVLKLDGTETDLDHGAKGKAEWKGDKLIATITAGRGPSSVTFSREGAWLIQEGTSARGPVKLYFKKAAAK